MTKEKTVISSYFCCLADYEKLAPIDGLKFPVNKLELKEAPLAERHPFWFNKTTGKKHSEI